MTASQWSCIICIVIYYSRLLYGDERDWPSNLTDYRNQTIPQVL
jgi:hypothetical protein